MSKKIVTHNSKFHTDDVFALATLLILYPDAEVIRTRDEEIIKTADIVVDVGGIYEPKNNRFDHHQKGGAGIRGNGVEYASFGLVWNKFGQEVSGSKEIADKMDLLIVQSVDATDNGQDIISSIIPGLFPFTINRLVDQYRTTWKEEENWDSNFKQAVSWARSVIRREIKIINDALEGTKIIENLYKDSTDKQIIVIDDRYDFGRETVGGTLVKFPEPIYAVLYRQDTQSWQVLAIKKNIASFELRKGLPESWRAKRDSELESLTGFKGSLFCHRSGFMCTAESKEIALALARLALVA